MQAAADDFRLEAGFAIKGDDPPSGTDPFTDQSFSTMPTRLLAMYASRKARKPQ